MGLVEELSRVRVALRDVLVALNKTYIQNLHREMLIEEQWPLFDTANVARIVLEGVSGE